MPDGRAVRFFHADRGRGLMLNLLFGLADFDLRGGDTGAIAIADLGGEIGLDVAAQVPLGWSSR